MTSTTPLPPQSWVEPITPETKLSRLPGAARSDMRDIPDDVQTVEDALRTRTTLGLSPHLQAGKTLKHFLRADVSPADIPDETVTTPGDVQFYLFILATGANCCDADGEDIEFKSATFADIAYATEPTKVMLVTRSPTFSHSGISRGRCELTSVGTCRHSARDHQNYLFTSASAAEMRRAWLDGFSDDATVTLISGEFLRLLEGVLRLSCTDAQSFPHIGFKQSHPVTMVHPDWELGVVVAPRVGDHEATDPWRKTSADDLIVIESTA